MNLCTKLSNVCNEKAPQLRDNNPLASELSDLRKMLAGLEYEQKDATIYTSKPLKKAVAGLKKAVDALSSIR